MLLPHSSTLQSTNSRLACNTAHSCCWPGVDTGLVQISGGQGAGMPVHLPSTLELPKGANIWPLSFRCTKGVYRSHMDAEDGCGGESRSPAHTTSPPGYPSTVCSQLCRWNKSQSFGSLTRSCKSIPQEVPFTSPLSHGISKRGQKMRNICLFLRRPWKFLRQKDLW